MRTGDVYVARLGDVRVLEDGAAKEDSLVRFCMQRSALVPGLPVPPAATLVHAFLDATAVAITHPVSLLAFAATERPEALVNEAFGGRIAFLPCPQVDVSVARKAAHLVRSRPHLSGILLGRRGLLNWAGTPEECLSKVRSLNAQAVSFSGENAARPNPERAQTAGVRVQLGDREEALARILPTLRGLLGLTRGGVLYVDDDPASLRLLAQEGVGELVRRMKDAFELAWLDPSTLKLDAEAIRSALASGISRAPSGRGETGENPSASATRRRPVVLLPGLGVVSGGASVSDAKHTAELFKHSLALTRHAEVLGGFVAEPARAGASETRTVRAPEDRPISDELSGRVVLVTGGASGIGRSIAVRFAAEGASVVVLDIDEAGAERVAEEIEGVSGVSSALALRCDVSDEGSVSAAFRRAVLDYGGVDVVVANAGIAISEAIEDTPLEKWQRVQDVNLTGYFLTAREAFRVFRAQGGGNLLFISSKAGLAAGPGSTAYGSSKAAELHLARILAEEGGPSSIRVNSVCPDAVFQGSSLWRRGWRQERARFYGIDPKEVEEHYRRRCALKVAIYPEDVAEAALFLVSDRSAKITGAVLNVDGGVGAAYVR